MYIQIENLTKVFYEANKKPFVVLSDINLTIKKSEFICIIGPSGCGKTALLNILGGFVPPTNGRVLIDGEEVKKPSSRYVSIFQDYKLLPWRTVRKNIELGLENKKLSRAQINEIVDAQIHAVGLSGFENYMPATISGGMKQRVSIARALAVEPDILFMDEPFGALDSVTKETMQLNLKQLLSSKPGGTTVIFITHDVDEAVFLADRILVMSAKPGKINNIIEVDLPQPTMKYTRSFNAVRDNVIKEMAAVSHK
ncbi:MAG: ABC transporter ATP-binding protein [Firmicutes bacterium]|nr:ABC transporter ATP-binding protein [Bacillota bacterium]